MSNSKYSKIVNSYGKSIYKDGVEVKTISKKSVFKFLGGFKDSMKEGFGIEKWKNNKKYIGFYKDDLFDGYGKLRKQNGDSIHGMN